jgi:hypothetical protein
MLKAPLRFCVVELMPIERSPKRISFKLALRHDLSNGIGPIRLPIRAST